VAGAILNWNENNWEYLFFILGTIFVLNVLLVIATLKADPGSMGIVINLETLPLSEDGENFKPVTICEALKIPEVLLYGFSYFWTKLVWINYLSWLPTYIS
jgi:hypothetical protein